MKTKNKMTDEYLPAWELLREYPKDNWLVIGHLTHAKTTSAETQLKHFKAMMHALGYKNRVFGRRLHWIVRVGGHPDHIHLHFLLGKEQLTNGHRHSFRPEEVMEFIKEYWKGKHGMRVVDIFDSSRPGIEYVLRREPRGHGNEADMSEGLTSEIKKRRKQRLCDELGMEIVNILKASGVRAGFGDKMEAIRRGAA